jgi:hypothetical protein
MPDYQKPGRNELEDLRETFAAEDALGEFGAGLGRGKAHAGGAALYSLVRSAQTPWSSLTPGKRAAARQMERMISEVEFPLPVAAADTGPLDRRASGYLIRSQPSAGDEGWTWIIVEFPVGYAGSARRLIAWRGEDERAEISLPPARRGVSQAMIENDSALYRMLCDPKSVVLLG